jgi:hypothetical protein
MGGRIDMELIAGIVNVQVVEDWAPERSAEHGKLDLGGVCSGGGLIASWRPLAWAGRWSGGRACQRTRRAGGWSIDW